MDDTNVPFDSPSAVIAMRRRHLEIGLRMQAVALRALKELERKAEAGQSLNLSAEEAKTLLNAGAKLERAALGAVGNRLSSLSMPNYNYNVSNELTSNSNGSYTYDANGNTLSDAQGRTFTWDFENRLNQAVVLGSNGGTTTFKYDPFGRRIQKSGPLGTTNYLYDGFNDTEEVDGVGNVQTRYAQATSIDEPLSEFRSGTVSYYEQDGVGSTLSLTSPTGSLGNTYVYDSFGKLTASSGSVINPFEYTGREFDPETGIYEYRMRYYDQSAGRFISEDPHRSLFGLNRYKYVSNHPITFNDPLGLSDTCTPDHEDQLTPWIPTSTNGLPITGWTFSSAGEAGGPDADSGVAAAQLYCVWKRMVSKTRSSVALIDIEWKCTYLMPCGYVGTYYKSTWEWRRRWSTFTDFETTTTRVLIMGTDSDAYDEWFCRTYLRP